MNTTHRIDRIISYLESRAGSPATAQEIAAHTKMTAAEVSTLCRFYPRKIRIIAGDNAYYEPRRYVLRSDGENIV